MTPDEIRALLAYNVGKRVWLESRRAMLSGVIHGVVGQQLQVVRSVTVPRHPSKPIVWQASDWVDKWGTPTANVVPQRVDGKIIFAYNASSRLIIEL